MFPYISHINDVLPHIEGRDEFIVADRGDHTIINYQVVLKDTFPDLDQEGAGIRRECRGIIFDKDGYIIRRPLEKFFNLNEKEETRLDNLGWISNAIVKTKMDGSMIAPYKIDDRIIWGTKMGDTDIARDVEDIYSNLENYWLFVNYILDSDATPIFEYTAPTNQIVLKYQTPDLTLLAVRDNLTGQYYNRNYIVPICEKYNIPLVREYYPEDIKSFIESIKDMVDIEGFILEDPKTNYKVKVKCDWYVTLHKTLDHILHEKDVILLLLNNELDDAKQILPKETVDALEEYNDILVSNIGEFSNHIWRSMLIILNSCEGQRKYFAQQVSKEKEKIFYFKALDYYLKCPNPFLSPEFYNYVLDYVKNSCSSQTKVDEARYIWNDSWQNIKERNSI